MNRATSCCSRSLGTWILARARRFGQGRVVPGEHPAGLFLALAGQAVELLADLQQPPAAGQPALAHDAGQDPVRVRVLVVKPAEAERPRALLPGRDGQGLGRERGVAPFLELVGGQEDLLRHGEVGNGVHAVVPLCRSRLCRKPLGQSSPGRRWNINFFACVSGRGRGRVCPAGLAGRTGPGGGARRAAGEPAGLARRRWERSRLCGACGVGSVRRRGRGWMRRLREVACSRRGAAGRDVESPRTAVRGPFMSQLSG